MKAFLFGAVQRTGKAKASGNPYDMSRLLIGQQIVPVARENMQVRGVGFEQIEVECTPQVIDALAGFKLPAMVEFEMEHQPKGGKLVPVAVGLSQVKAA